MLTIRLRADSDVARVVLIGTLELDDVGAVTDALEQARTDGSQIRIVVLKMWRADETALASVRHLVMELRQAGRGCHWIGALPLVRSMLNRAQELAYVTPPDEADLDSARGWGLDVQRWPG
jgi:hypothetical protein